MNKLALPLTFSAITLLSACASTPETLEKQAEVALSGYQQQVSYVQGMEYMKNLRKDDLSVDKDAFLLGIDDVQANREPRLSTEEITKAKDWLLVEQVKHQEAKSAANMEISKAFLAENQKREGVMTLESGLQYKVLNAGEGKQQANANDTVEIHFRLTKTDGSEIDSTLKRGKTAFTPVNSLIPGAKEALQLMNKGAKWQLFIPSKLAYGEKGTPDGKIAPSEVLVFELELVAINPPEALAAAADASAPKKPKLSSTWK